MTEVLIPKTEPKVAEERSQTSEVIVVSEYEKPHGAGQVSTASKQPLLPWQEFPGNGELEHQVQLELLLQDSHDANIGQ